MKKKFITINKIAGKIQYLTEVLPQIETNTILCKTLTGLGATYSEIKAKRHSIISVPNVPPIIGKCRDPKHKNDNLFGVKQGVTTEEVIDYIEKTLAAGKFIKLISTPEGFAKIKRAFEELELMWIGCSPQQRLAECQVIPFIIPLLQMKLTTAEKQRLSFMIRTAP